MVSKCGLNYFREIFYETFFKTLWKLHARFKEVTRKSHMVVVCHGVSMEVSRDFRDTFVEEQDKSNEMFTMRLS